MFSNHWLLTNGFVCNCRRTYRLYCSNSPTLIKYAKQQNESLAMQDAERLNRTSWLGSSQNLISAKGPSIPQLSVCATSYERFLLFSYSHSNYPACGFWFFRMSQPCSLSYPRLTRLAWRARSLSLTSLFHSLRLYLYSCRLYPVM